MPSLLVFQIIMILIKYMPRCLIIQPINNYSDTKKSPLDALFFVTKNECDCFGTLIVLFFLNLLKIGALLKQLHL